MIFFSISEATDFILDHQADGRKFDVADVTNDLASAARTVALNWTAPKANHWATTYMTDMKFRAMTKKGMSVGQVKGVLNVVRAEATPKAPKVEVVTVLNPAPALNVSKVRTARFRVVPDDGQSIAIRLSIPTQWTDAPKGTRKLSVRQADGWLTVGKVTPGGEVQVFKKAGPALEIRVRQALFILANADNDLVYILDYAMEGNSCGFCGLDLDTAESLSVGYGPQCAKKHDLPWGAKAVPAKVILAKAGLAAKPDYDIQTDTDGAVVSLAGFKLRPSVYSEADDLAVAADLANDQAVGN